jgi:hypothetical protein
VGTGVVDEVRMLVCQAQRGKGTRVFADRQDLKLAETTGFDNRRGTAALRDHSRGLLESL